MGRVRRHDPAPWLSNSKAAAGSVQICLRTSSCCSYSKLVRIEQIGCCKYQQSWSFLFVVIAGHTSWQLVGIGGCVVLTVAFTFITYMLSLRKKEALPQ